MRIVERAARKFGLIPPEDQSDVDQIVELVAQARARTGRPPLRPAEALHHAAAGHSADMATGEFVSHTGSDGSDPASRATAAGYPVGVLAENLASGAADPSGVVRMWLDSPEHSNNLLDPAYTEIGAGHARRTPATDH